MTTAKQLVNACETKNRALVLRLIAEIPREGWQVTPGLATSCLTPVTVQVWHASGGSGINTYETVHASVLLDDQVMPIFAGTFTVEELQLPNYIPKEVRGEPASRY
jgi:hypothetical protein